MKQATLGAIALSCAVVGFAQGTVVFNNRTAAGNSHVWWTPDFHFQLQGDGANYPGVGGTLIGTTGGLPAQTTFAALLGGPAGSTEAQLIQGNGAQTTFRTGAAAGGIAATTATFDNIAKDAASGVFEMVAWDNSSGLYSNWAVARTAWQARLIAAGTSTVFSVDNIGGDVNTPPFLVGLTSFNIFYVVPEPASLALVGLGAAALLIFGRRK